MRKFVYFIVFVIFLSLLLPIECTAENIAAQQAESLGFDEIENVVEKNNEKYNIDIDFEELLYDRLDEDSGENINFFKKILDIFLREIKGQGYILRNIFIICVLSGIFRCFTDSFKTKEITETGFYVCYMAVFILMLDSFMVGLGILSDVVDFTSDLSKASAPVIAAVMIGCGETAAGGAAAAIILFACEIMTDFINIFFIPAMKAAAVISIVNHLSSRQMLERLSVLISDGLGKIMKAGAFLFMAVVSMQKISTSAADNALSKTLQAGIGAVPVVGDVFSSAAESILSWSGVLKTGVGISIVFACVFSAIAPIVKILMIMLLYKVTAVLIEPFSDKRITLCIDKLGSYMALSLSAAVTVIIMFTFAVIIFISAIGG